MNFSDNPHPNMAPILKELRISFHEDGQVIVGGCLQDKPICFYMLELAKDTIKTFDANDANNRLEGPSA